MRSGQISRAALFAAAAVIGASSAGATGSETKPEAIAFPPLAPALAAPPAMDSAAAMPATPAAAEPAVAIEVPPPVLKLPAEAPKVDVPARPVFTLGPALIERLKREKLTGADREDRDAAVKVYEAREGAPLWVDAKGPLAKALALMGEIKAADSYGLTAAAFKLPAVDAAGRELSEADLADFEATLSLAAMKYARHARGGRFEPSQLSKFIDRKAQVYSASSVLGELAAAGNPDRYLRELHPRHAQFERLRQKYLAVRAGQTVIEPPAPVAEAPQGKGKSATKTAATPALTPEKLEKKLLANMEMWRWMPDDLGDYHIANNIPEFTTRMYRGGKLVHAERIITGTQKNQTPVFSDEMELVVFKPFWNVPESIKWKELQPQLLRDGGALSRAGLRAAYNGRDVDPRTVDWASADMRAFHIFQPPGSSNALGQVKFLFPNKHDVYMHDTNQRSLFVNSARAFSHGCMRVQNPMKFAELLLSQDKGWDMARVVQTANSGPENNEVRLNRKVPVHVTYFTATVGDDGKLNLFNDVYGHEPKVHMGMEGKAHLIVQPREEKYEPPVRGQVRFVERQGTKGNNPIEDWMKKVFNF